MKILHNDDLKNALLKKGNKKISIVSAFAVHTEMVVEQLLEDNNIELELIISTINAFNSFDFIKFCQQKAQDCDKFSFYVDFRYNQSVHWKLYLIQAEAEPETVIIGSANFTNTGIGLTRDTCVMIQNKKLYADYLVDVEQLKQLPEVVKSSDQKFDRYLQNYKTLHQSITKASIPTLANYLVINPMIELGLLVWDSYLSDEDEQVAEEVVAREHPTIKFDMNRDCLLVEKKYEKDFSVNQLILCMNNQGKEIEFFYCLGIYPSQSQKDVFLFNFSKKAIRPFKLSRSLEAALAKQAASWCKSNKHKLTYEDLLALCENS